MTRTVPSYEALPSAATTQAVERDVQEKNDVNNQPSLAIPLAARQKDGDWKPRQFCRPFCRFLTNNPTTYHAVEALAKELASYGYKHLSERETWEIEKGGKYFVERNGSSIIAFAVGDAYESGNGVAMIAGHVDALTAKIKPIPNLESNAGYVQLGVAPYADAFNSSWWDRDLGIAGRVIVRDETGKCVTKLVDLHEPIAFIPSLAPHFGPVSDARNKETRMVPIVGLESSERSSGRREASSRPPVEKRPNESFISKQPQRLVRAIANQMNITDTSTILNWDLELYDVQQATVGGLDKEFIRGPRIDDKACSWAAMQALMGASFSEQETRADSGIIKCVACFDDEEIGSLLRQGAHGNFLPITIERIVESLATSNSGRTSLLAQTYANSFLISADVTHAVNPNFLDAYLPHHYPYLNTGVVIEADPNGNTTTDAVSTAIVQRVAQLCGSTVQVSQIRNNVRSGGTVGPMLSSAMGVRAIDAGIAELSMHALRTTTGALDPGLGVKLFKGFFDHFEAVDKEFSSS